jgi:hypothetical protein
MTPTLELKPFHHKSLRRALNILIDDHNAGKMDSGGWCHGTQVGNWRTADQLVEAGMFEKSIDSKKIELDSRRYRILPFGIEQIIKQGDILKLKDGSVTVNAKLLTISASEYRFYVEYYDIGAPGDGIVKRWRDLREFDLSDYTREWEPEQRTVLRDLQQKESFYATLTSPEIPRDEDDSDSPYTTVTIEADVYTEYDGVPAAPIPPRQDDPVDSAHERLATDIRSNTPEREQAPLIGDEMQQLRNRITELETLLKLERAGQAVVEAISMPEPVDEPEKIEVMYFNELISRPDDQRSAATKLAELLNAESWLIVHEEFIYAGDSIRHVARLEREVHTGNDKTESNPNDKAKPHPVDFDAALDEVIGAMQPEGLTR